MSEAQLRLHLKNQSGSFNRNSKFYSSMTKQTRSQYLEPPVSLREKN